MLTILRVHLQSHVPVVGCEVVPYVWLRHPDNHVSTDDANQLAGVNGCCIKYKWLVFFPRLFMCICNDVIFLIGF